MRFPVAALVATLAMQAGLAQAQPLIVDGELIADAELLAAGKKEGRVVHYGTYPESSFKIISDAFTKDTGIRVTYLRLTTQNMFPRVTAEFAAGKLEADIVDITDLPLVQQMMDMGILNVAHKTPSFDKLPPGVRDDQGRWYSIVRPTSAIVVNIALVKEADYPKSYKDLLDPKWAGKIALPGIDAGGSAFSLFMFLRDSVSPDYWPRLAALKPRVHPAIIPATTDLIRGEASILIGGPEPAMRQIADGAPVKVIFPVEGISSFPAAGGITSKARNSNAAKVFINWMMSAHGARTIATTGAYAAHPDGPAPMTAGIQFPPAAQVWNIPIGAWIEKRESYSKEWRAAFTGGR